MGILSWVVLGFLAGLLAKMLHPGKDPGGLIVTILIGIVGAFIGGYIGVHLGLGAIDEFNIKTLGLSVAGAFLLLMVYRFIIRA